jgi:hypothetical protein
VTNSTGACTSTDQVVVTVNPTAVAPTSASVDRTISCNNDAGNITLTATGGSGTTLKWYTGSCGGTLIGTGNNLSITSPESTTTYYVSWENTCGFSSCASVTASVPSAISASASAGTISCNGASTTLTVTASGGTGSLQYSLNGGVYQAGNTFTVNATGSPYTVTVKDANNCTQASNSVIVTQPAALALGTPSTTITTCPAGNDGKIVIAASGGTGVITYSISPATGVQSPSGTFNNLTAQSYTITATDASGCTNTRAVTVNANPDITPPVIANCASNTTIQAGLNGQAQVPNLIPLVTASDNCTATGSLVIVQSPAAGTTVLTGETTITCDGLIILDRNLLTLKFLNHEKIKKNI